MSCLSALTHIRFYRDNYPDLDIPTPYMGTDSCENYFGALGSCTNAYDVYSAYDVASAIIPPTSKMKMTFKDGKGVTHHVQTLIREHQGGSNTSSDRGLRYKELSKAQDKISVGTRMLDEINTSACQTICQGGSVALLIDNDNGIETVAYCKIFRMIMCEAKKKVEWTQPVVLDSVKDLSSLQLEVSEWIPTKGAFKLGPCWTQPIAATAVIGPAVLVFDSQIQVYKPSPNTLAFIDNYKEVNINCRLPIVSDETPGDAGDETSGDAIEDCDTNDTEDDEVDFIYDKR